MLLRIKIIRAMKAKAINVKLNIKSNHTTHCENTNKFCPRAILKSNKWHTLKVSSSISYRDTKKFPLFNIKNGPRGPRDFIVQNRWCWSGCCLESSIDDFCMHVMPPPSQENWKLVKFRLFPCLEWEKLQNSNSNFIFFKFYLFQIKNWLIVFFRS